MSSPTPAIQVENLSYAYGRAEAIHDLSLAVQPGRCYGLFGRNGAGKTTTMKCLLNLLRPQRGQVRVFGLDPAKQEVAVKRLLSYVPDQVAFYPWMSAEDGTGVARAFWARSGAAHGKSVEGPENPSGVDRGGLPGDGSAGAR